MIERHANTEVHEVRSAAQRLRHDWLHYGQFTQTGQSSYAHNFGVPMALDATIGKTSSPDAAQFTESSGTLFDSVNNENTPSNSETAPPASEQHPPLSASIVGSDHARGMTNVIGQIGTGIGKELTDNLDGVLYSAAFGAVLGAGGKIAFALAPKSVIVGATVLGASAAAELASNAPVWCRDMATSFSPEGKNLADVMAAENRLREFGASSLNFVASGAAGAEGLYLARFGTAPAKVALTKTGSFLSKTAATIDEAISVPRAKMNDLLALKTEKTLARRVSELGASIRGVVEKDATITDAPPTSFGLAAIKQFQKDADGAMTSKFGPNFFGLDDNSRLSKWFAWRPKGDALDDGTRFGLNSIGLVERIVTDKNVVHVRHSQFGKAVDVRYVDAGNHLHRATAVHKQPGVWEGNVFGVDRPKWYGEFDATHNKWIPATSEMRATPFAKVHQV